MRCKRCGRILKNEESIKRGYGSGCYKKHLEEIQNPTITLDDFNLGGNKNE